MIHITHNTQGTQPPTLPVPPGLLPPGERITRTNILGPNGKIPLNYTLEHSTQSLLKYFGRIDFGVRQIQLYLASKIFPSGEKEPTCFLSIGEAINTHQRTGRHSREQENVLNFNVALEVLAKSVLQDSMQSIETRKNPYIVTASRYEIRDYIRKFNPQSERNSTKDVIKHIISNDPTIIVPHSEISPYYSSAMLIPMVCLDRHEQITGNYGYVLRGIITQGDDYIFDEKIITTDEAAKHLENLHKASLRGTL